MQLKTFEVAIQFIVQYKLKEGKNPGFTEVRTHDLCVIDVRDKVLDHCANLLIPIGPNLIQSSTN